MDDIAFTSGGATCAGARSPGIRSPTSRAGGGVVHNALLLAGTERTVVRGRFRPLTGRRLTAFAARPRWSALGGIFASALRG